MVCELRVGHYHDVTDQFMVVGPDEVEDLTAVGDIIHGLSHAVLGHQPAQHFALLLDLGTIRLQLLVAGHRGQQRSVFPEPGYPSAVVRSQSQ